MKKIAVLLVAAMLALTLVGCADVTKVSLTDQSIKAQGPALKDLVGTWSMTETASYIAKTVVTDSSLDSVATLTVETMIPTSTRAKTLVIAKGEDKVYTYSYTETETAIDPGMLISNRTVDGSTTVTTSYSSVISVGWTGDSEMEESTFDYAYALTAPDKAGSVGTASPTWGVASGGDWVIQRYTALALVPVNVPFAGVLYTTTRSGTISEYEYYESVLGRTKTAFSFDNVAASTVSLVAQLNSTTTPTLPVWAYSTSTSAEALEGTSMNSDNGFVYIPETKTWSMVSGSFAGLTLAVEE